jgi:hypothetical protein
MGITARKATTFALVIGLIVAFAMFAFGVSGVANAADSPPSEDGVNPIVEDGNLDCADLNADASYPTVTSNFGFKIDANPTGGTVPYQFKNGTQNGDTTLLTGGAPTDTSNSVTLTPTAFESGSGDTTVFDWTATIGVDAIIVKAQDSNVYVYTPEDLGDGGLQAPDLKAISHVEFCYDYELSVKKTAQTELTRTFKWTIDKSVSPETWDLFPGDSGTSKYTVGVTKDTGTDSAWAVSGTITVTNPTPFNVPVTNVTDAVSGGAGAANVDCSGVTFPHTLSPGGTLNCTYSKEDLPDAQSRTNTATAKSGLASTSVGDGIGTAAVDFANAKINKVNDSISVNDSVQGSLGTFNASGSKTYNKTFTCDGDEGTHDNTASISPASASSNPSDSASVTVNCHALTVTKDADTSFTRTYKWTLDKTASPTEKTIATGESFLASYSVLANATHTDSDYGVSGTITVSNPADAPDATINSVTDAVSGGAGAANVDCSVSFPYELKAGEELNCTYTKEDLPDKTTRTNTATATLQNKSYDSAGTATNSGTTNFSGEAAVDFSNATMSEVDEQITVSDPAASPDTLGTATAGVDTLPKTFPTYSQTIGPYSTCGDKTVDNTASFETNDTKTTGSDTATVTAHVQCKLTVLKDLVPDTDTGKFNLLIDGVVKAANVGDGGTTGAQAVTLNNNHTVSETQGTGTYLSEYVSQIKCTGDTNPSSGTSKTVSFASGDSDKTCTITNTKKGKVTVKKTTDGVVNSTKSIDFKLTGAGLPSGGVTLNTFGDQDGVLDFGYALVPGSQYTVCENPVPAGFTSLWKLDGTIVTPYNPNASDSPPQDLGVRCYNFSASTSQTRAFEIDNSHPGGDPRTIGYWKNWNKCTGGKQATTAAKNGGAAAGVFIVEDLLPQLIGDFNVTTCQQAVKVLSKQDQGGTNRAKDAAYELAAQFLAAKLNLAAGAETCAAVETAVTNGQALLDQINFTGSGTYLDKSSTNRTKALNLAATLDRYNNGNLC